MPDERPSCDQLLRQVSTPSRWRILQRLAAGPETVGALAGSLALEQSLVSHHLAVLRRLGLVRRERRGSEMYYSSLLSGDDGVWELGCCQIRFRAGGPPCPD